MALSLVSLEKSFIQEPRGEWLMLINLTIQFLTIRVPFWLTVIIFFVKDKNGFYSRQPFLEVDLVFYPSSTKI